MGAIITITINGTQTTASSTDSILNIINQYKLNPSSVIVELNEHIIKKNDYETTKLNENDRIELIRYIGGGACQNNESTISKTIK